MALAVVGGAFLGAAANVLIDRLASREVISFFSKRKSDHGLGEKLKKQLLALKAVLDDAEKKQISNKHVKEWLDELQYVVYQAGDLLDEITTKASRDKSEAGHAGNTTPKVGFGRYFRPIKQSLFRKKHSVYLSDEEMESGMKDINTQLKEFVDQIGCLNLRGNDGRKQSQMQPITTSLIEEDDVCGRKDEKEEIIKLLISGSATVEEIPVIPIVGMGGIGKTTLAQSVYQDARVSDHFCAKSWVCVSDVFDVFKITKKILDDVAPSNDNNNIDNLDQLQTKLKKSLTEKKFLVVLDDVWNDNYLHWDALKKPFKNGKLESRIIVTTRNNSVSSIMRTISSHVLKPLPAEECWLLFAKHAFVKGDYTAYPELESIGRKIVKKCNGLPLALKSLGGLLRSNETVKEWESILESGIWNADRDRNISPALSISYYYLPSHLKRCFAYCSVFPKDYEFEMEKLVQLWMALDFVQQPKDNKSLEDEGNKYFHELLSRCFFQRSCHDNDSHFVMHDLIHDLAQEIFRDFFCRLDNDQPLVNISKKVCHFSYVRGKDDAFEKFKVVDGVKCLRTFMSYSKYEGYRTFSLGNKVIHDILPSQRCLRVLSLSNYCISELPESIKNLIHLRYLDVSGTSIKQLPDCVTSLCNLLLLDLSYCKSLTKLPVDMRKLIKLRRLDIRGTGLTEMPAEMSKLEDLRHLSFFVVGKNRRSSISELKELCHLSGEFRISGLENVVNGQVASEANMKDKKHLEGLELIWDGDANDSTKENDVLDKLEPPPGVKSVSISNYRGTRFPHWLGRDHSFPKMVSLSLISCAKCDILPSIGQLPSLKHLKIEGMKEITAVGREFYENASSSSSSSFKPFPSLETLSFKKMSEWKEWHAMGAGEFSRLQKLSIVDCPKLTGELPNNFPCLRKLEISGCDELVSSQIGLLLQGMPCLEELKMSKMANLTELPLELCRLVKIERMEIGECLSLMSFPDMGLPPTLKALEIRECRSLKFPVPEETDHNYHASIEVLKIIDSCDGLESLSFGFFPKLRDLYIYGCINFETISIPKEELQNLVRLSIFNCPKMVSFPHGNGNDGDAGGLLVAPNLTILRVSKCEKLKSLPQQMHIRLPSLQTLVIYDCPEIESFPEGGLPSTLRELNISNCPKLECLPQEGLPNSLSYLGIEDCPMVSARCQREKGQDWPIISGIPHVCI